MRLSYLLSLVSLVHHAVAVGAIDDLTTQYRVDFSTADKGGCEGNDTTLKASYAEAFLVAQAAIDALNSIRNNPSPNPKQDLAAALQISRVGQPFLALFGNTYFNQDGSLNLKQYQQGVDLVRGKFEDMQKDLTTDPRFNGLFGSKASIYCSSSWQKKLATTDPDPTDTENPQRPIADTQSNKDAVAWIFSITDNKLGESKDPSFDDPCGPGNLAFTSRNLAAITFCPSTLDGSAGIKASIADEKNRIQAGDPIGNHRTMAEMWVHEWNHLLSDGTDANAIDSSGNPILTGDNKPVKVYGWDNVVNLAKFQPEAARNTPDAYAIFGNAMFFDNFSWGSGKAVPARRPRQ